MGNGDWGSVESIRGAQTLLCYKHIKWPLRHLVSQLEREQCLSILISLSSLKHGVSTATKHDTTCYELTANRRKCPITRNLTWLSTCHPPHLTSNNLKASFLWEAGVVKPPWKVFFHIIASILVLCAKAANHFLCRRTLTRHTTSRLPSGMTCCSLIICFLIQEIYFLSV